MENELRWRIEPCDARFEPDPLSALTLPRQSFKTQRSEDKIDIV